jgi:hypothetical protein
MYYYNSIRILLILITISCNGFWIPLSVAQDSLSTIKSQSRQPCIFFPSPMYDRSWQFSIGFISTTTPRDITEEVHVRAPAGDFHALKKINSHFLADGRILFQVLQNHFAFGIKYATPLTNRLFISIGDDLAFWYGNLVTGDFDSHGSGWMNYPNISIGYKSAKDLFVTIKGESLLNIKSYFSNGGYVYSKDPKLFNGFAYTIALEQPFYKRKYLTLAFTAMYTNFNWQLWALFETFDRNIFYPQITVGLIL